MKQNLHRVPLYVNPKNSNHLRSHLRAIMVQILGKKNQADFFALDKFTLKNLTNKSGGV